MRKRDNLPLPDQLAASLRRVVTGGQPETLYDAAGTAVAVILPATEPASLNARDQFLQQLRAWRQGNPEAQRREWEQLQEVLAEERHADELA
jgi:hypothetical protein